MRLYLIIGAVFLTTLGGFYWYFSYSQKVIETLQANNAKLEVSIKSQNEAMSRLDNAFNTQTRELDNLRTQNVALINEKKELSDKLIKHDWEELSRRKPGLIENRINNGTKELFDSLTDITSN